MMNWSCAMTRAALLMTMLLIKCKTTTAQGALTKSSLKMRYIVSSSVSKGKLYVVVDVKKSHLDPCPVLHVMYAH